MTAEAAEVAAARTRNVSAVFLSLSPPTQMQAPPAMAAACDASGRGCSRMQGS